MNQPNLTPQIHLIQNSPTTSKKNNPRVTQHQKTTKLNPPLSKPHAINQKRKVPRTEENLFTKRLRQAVEGTEPVYFDPTTVSFIPRSELESFILANKELENHGESQSTPHLSSFPLVHDTVCSNSVSTLFSSDYTAEEAGLIMPPTSPWGSLVGTVEASATPRQFEP